MPNCHCWLRGVWNVEETQGCAVPGVSPGKQLPSSLRECRGLAGVDEDRLPTVSPWAGGGAGERACPPFLPCPYTVRGGNH